MSSTVQTKTDKALSDLIYRFESKELTNKDFYRETRALIGRHHDCVASHKTERLETQVDMLQDAATRSVDMLKWMLQNTRCDCVYNHTCGLEKHLKELGDIEQSIAQAMAQDKPAPKAMPEIDRITVRQKSATAVH